MLESVLVTSSKTLDNVFPTLSPEQLARIAAYGRSRPVHAGEVLVEPGEPHPRFFVVRHGSVEAFRPAADGEIVITVNRPGQFTGEGALVAGRPALVGIRVRDDGEV